MFTPFNYDLKPKAKQLRRNMTPAEKKLWFEYLRKNDLARFLRQKPIGEYVVDFYCAQRNLVIELDGDSHFDSEKAVKKDFVREGILRGEYSLRILRFSNFDVINNFEGVCFEIEMWFRENRV